MNSMTGFGRAEKEENGHKLAVELKSVNHRFLDTNIRMPRFMLFLEDDVRTLLKKRLARGRVDVFINYASVGDKPRSVSVDKGLVQGYLQAAQEILQVADVQNDLTLTRLMSFGDVIHFEEEENDEEVLRALLLDVMDTALTALEEARRAEGERIVKDIAERGELLSGLVARIEEREPLVVEEYRERLRQRLEELLEGTEIDPNRFNTEIAYFADKCSITEELVRLKSHLTQLGETLSAKSASGRSLDFLIQEFNREFNTIGSKAQDVAITKMVLEAKCEVEKIREQVQNIE